MFSMLQPYGGEAKEYRRPDGAAGFMAHSVVVPPAHEGEWTAWSTGLPSVQDVAAMDPDARRRVLMGLLGVDDSICTLPAALQLGVACLCFLLKRPNSSGKLDIRRMCSMIAFLQQPQDSLPASTQRPHWWRDGDTEIAQVLSEWHAALDAVDGLNAVLGVPLHPITPRLRWGPLLASQALLRWGLPSP